MRLFSIMSFNSCLNHSVDYAASAVSNGNRIDVDVELLSAYIIHKRKWTDRRYKYMVNVSNIYNRKCTVHTQVYYKRCHNLFQVFFQSSLH